MEIGKPKRLIVADPLERPEGLPRREAEPQREPERVQPEPEREPAHK